MECLYGRRTGQEGGRFGESSWRVGLSGGGVLKQTWAKDERGGATEICPSLSLGGDEVCKAVHQSMEYRHDAHTSVRECPTFRISVPDCSATVLYCTYVLANNLCPTIRSYDSKHAVLAPMPSILASCLSLSFTALSTGRSDARQDLLRAITTEGGIRFRTVYHTQSPTAW